MSSNRKSSLELLGIGAAALASALMMHRLATGEGGNASFTYRDLPNIRSEKTKSLHERIGGDRIIEPLMLKLCDKITSDVELCKHFTGDFIDHQRINLKSFLAVMLQTFKQDEDDGKFLLSIQSLTSRGFSEKAFNLVTRHVQVTECLAHNFVSPSKNKKLFNRHKTHSLWIQIKLICCRHV